MSKPLEGVRVIDMSHVIAGPLASFYLAQLGAEVIKVESPHGGEVMRSTQSPGEGDTPPGFVALNAGKRSLAVDIRKPEGADTVRTLARNADVFIENFRPGVVARYDLHYEAIRQLKPDIIYCSISPVMFLRTIIRRDTFLRKRNLRKYWTGLDSPTIGLKTEKLFLA